MTSTGSATSLSIVKELRRLAQNPSHREHILRNDVNSILIFVDPDEYPLEVVTEAVNALHLLAEEASERYVTCSAMRNTIGLLDLMKKIECREGYSVECKALAIKIQHLLNNSQSKPPPSSLSDAIITRSAGARASRRSVKFLGENKKAKVVILQIDNLTNQERRQQCVDVLVKVKGVISLTFNMASRRCILRVKSSVSPETLALAVNNTEVMEAYQVIKNESGDEVLIPFRNKMEDSLGGELPSYLDEEPPDSPDKRDQAVARPNSSGGFGSMASSWFGSVLNAVNKNLYW